MATEDEKQPIINTILLQGARVETLMSAEEFWQQVTEKGISDPIKALDVLNCEISFLKSGVVGFIDRKKMEIPEGMKEMVAAAGRSAGLAPQGRGSGIVVPGAPRPY